MSSTTQATVTSAPAPAAASDGTATSTQPQKGGKPGRGKKQGTPTTSAPPPAPQKSAPAPKQKAANPNPSAVSKPPSLTGWGTLPTVVPYRRVVRHRIETSPSGYFDLVEEEYSNLLAKHNHAARMIPRSLFIYYCGLAWWKRILFLKSRNDTLTSNEREALRLLEHDFLDVLPDRLHQYLSCVGNYNNGSEEVHHQAHVSTYSSSIDITTQQKATATTPKSRSLRGWSSHTAGSLQYNAESFWDTLRAPVPGLLSWNILTEAHPSVFTHHVPAAIIPSPATIGTADSTVVRYTRNIVGYFPPLDAQHSSWAMTFDQLGWRATSLPSDLVTDWSISPDTLRWVNDRLASLPTYKVVSTKSHLDTVTGHFMQHYWLSSVPGEVSVDHTETERLPFSQAVPVGLRSANPIPADIVAPAFAFALRMDFAETGGLASLKSAPFYPRKQDGTVDNFAQAIRDTSNPVFNAPDIKDKLPPTANIICFMTSSQRRNEVLTHLYS